MILAEGTFDVPAGKIAAVVTHLEMTDRPALLQDPPGAWTLRRVETPDLQWYRELYQRIGEAWLWSWRIRLSDTELEAIVRSPLVEVHALGLEGRDEGLLELDFRQRDQCEIALFGVTAKLIGSGAGRWLMNRALQRAWSRPVMRLWVHTCSLDHPSAFAFYQKSGFRPCRRQIEITADPRLDGILPRLAARHVPVIT